MDLDAYRRYKRYKTFQRAARPGKRRQSAGGLDHGGPRRGAVVDGVTPRVDDGGRRCGSGAGPAGLGRLNQATKDAAEGDSFIDTAVSYAVRSNPAALGAMKLLELARPKALEATEAGGLVAEQRIAGQTTSPVQSFREGAWFGVEDDGGWGRGQGPCMLADIATFGGISMATVGGENPS